MRAELVERRDPKEEGYESFRFHRPFQRTDALGICRVEVPGPGTYRYSATSPAEGGTSTTATVQAGPGTTPVEIRFPAGVEVSGRVVDAEGKGLAGAYLNLRGEDASSQRAGAPSGEDGAFVFRQVPDGTFHLFAFHQGYEQSRETPVTVVVAGREVRGLEVRLDRQAEGIALTGRLLGLPPEDVAQAQVGIYPQLDSGSNGKVAPDGRYEIRGIRPGDWQVVAQVRGRRRLELPLHVEPGDAAAVLDFDFTKDITLSGRVLVDGAPLAGANVEAAGETFRSAQTRYDGGFELHDLKPGRYRLTVLAERGVVGHGQAVEIDGDRELIVRIETGVLRGRVISATGEPVPEALVAIDAKTDDPGFSFSAPDTRSGEDGLFEARLAAGRYLVTVRQEGYEVAQAVLEVRPGEAGAPVEIRLKSAAKD